MKSLSILSENFTLFYRYFEYILCVISIIIYACLLCIIYCMLYIFKLEVGFVVEFQLFKEQKRVVNSEDAKKKKSS